MCADCAVEAGDAQEMGHCLGNRSYGIRVKICAIVVNREEEEPSALQRVRRGSLRHSYQTPKVSARPASKGMATKFSGSFSTKERVHQ